MWCTHMWPQPHSMTPQCPPGVLHEDHGKLRARVRHFESTLGWCISRLGIAFMNTDKICHGLYYVLTASREQVGGKKMGGGGRGREGGVCCRLPFWRFTFFKAPLPSAQKPFWKSICNTAYFFSAHFIRQYSVGAVSMTVCIVMNMCMCVCKCFMWSRCVHCQLKNEAYFLSQKGTQTVKCTSTSWLRHLGTAFSFSRSSLLNSIMKFLHCSFIYTHLSMVLRLHYILWKTSRNDIGP